MSLRYSDEELYLDREKIFESFDDLRTRCRKRIREGGYTEEHVENLRSALRLLDELEDLLR